MDISLISIVGMGIGLVWHLFNVIKLQPVSINMTTKNNTTFSEDVVIGAIRVGVNNSYLECDTAEKILTLFYLLNSNENLDNLKNKITTILVALTTENFTLIVKSVLNIWNKIDKTNKVFKQAQNKVKTQIKSIC